MGSYPSKTEERKQNIDSGTSYNENEENITTSEIFLIRQKQIQTVTNDLKFLKQCPAYSQDTWTERNRTVIDVLNVVFTPLFDEPRLTTIQHRKTVVSLMISEDTLQILCNFCTAFLKAVDFAEDVVNAIIHVFMNYSDDFEEVRSVIANDLVFVKSLYEKISNIADTCLSNSTQNDLLKYGLALFHNLSKTEGYVLRQNGCFELFKHCLTSTNCLIRLYGLVVLANIVNEEECTLLANDDLMPFLMTMFEEAVRNNKKLCLVEDIYFSALELAQTIRQLSRNDNNKKSLVSYEALPLLVLLAEIGDIEEKRESIRALWSLSFEVDNKLQMITDETCRVIDIFYRFMSSKDSEIADLCKKALWTMRDDLIESERYKDLGLQLLSVEENVKKSQNDIYHVMLSYNRQHREKVAKIRDFMTSKNLRVWMDIDQMRGSLLDAMASAVDKAVVVLICYSPWYKDSDNCRMEAQYAHQKKKNILFLKMDSDYEPDGWLGILLGCKKFYDFSGKYGFDEKMKELIRDIQSELNKPGYEKHINAVPLSTHDPNMVVSIETSTLPPKQHIKSVQCWSNKDLDDWLNSHLLPRKVIKNLQSIDIAFLCVLMSECPEVFYQIIRDQLGIKDIPTMAKLRFALDSINISSQT